MSAIIVAKKLVETRLATITPSIPIAYENIAFTPPANGSKYLRCNLTIGSPDDRCKGSTYYRENAFLHVYVMDKLNIGTTSALTTAEIVKALFPKGFSIEEGGTRVNVLKTPHIAGAVVTLDRLVCPITIQLTIESM